MRPKSPLSNTSDFPGGRVSRNLFHSFRVRIGMGSARMNAGFFSESANRALRWISARPHTSLPFLDSPWASSCRGFHAHVVIAFDLRREPLSKSADRFANMGSNGFPVDGRFLSPSKNYRRRRVREANRRNKQVTL